MVMNITILAAYLVGLMLIYIVARLLFVPIKLIVRVIVNGLVGFALLWLLNWAGGFIGLHVGMNPVTALVAGFLGIPGVVLLVVLRYFVA